jgi:hypothetical protein
VNVPTSRSIAPRGLPVFIALRSENPAVQLFAHRLRADTMIQGPGKLHERSPREDRAEELIPETYVKPDDSANSRYVTPSTGAV